MNHLVCRRVEHPPDLLIGVLAADIGIGELEDVLAVGKLLKLVCHFCGCTFRGDP
jgi:hypothetical protein